MDTLVSLRDANQAFARYIRQVEAGAAYTITRNGAPVARLVPIDPGQRRLTVEQQAARTRTRTRTAVGWAIGAGAFDRDSLHER